MNYEEALAYIHNRSVFSTAPGLERIRNLMSALGNPQEKYPCIHIAGTNGKGSTAAFTASVMQEAGLKTGLFTSPYLIRFTERFQICGVPISESELAEITAYVQTAEEKLELQGMEPVNEFEIITAIGFEWFARQSCDIVVLEVGLGGRLDPTNIIQFPLCTCITSISLDHMNRLGSTIPEIAYEKAGIIKSSCPVVTPACQNEEALSVIRTVCREQGAELLTAQPEQIRSCDQTGSQFTIDGCPVEISLLGKHQIINASAAWKICREKGIRAEIIAAGLKKTVWPGRMQLISRSPAVLVDCAHNEDGIGKLKENLECIFPEYQPVLLMAMMADKEYKKCVRCLSESAVRLYATTLQVPRALQPELLAAESSCGETYVIKNLEEAVHTALAHLREGEMLVICGSVYLAGTVLPLLTE